MMALVPQRNYMPVNKTYTTLYSILRSAGSVLCAWILKVAANNYSCVYLIFGIIYIVSLIFIIVAGSKELPTPRRPRLPPNLGGFLWKTKKFRKTVSL